MTTSQLIQLLQKALADHGDLPIHYALTGGEYSPADVKFVRAGCPVTPGAITGNHQFQPDRLIISGQSLS